MKIIIGAGLCGIGAGLGLLSRKEEFLILERQKNIGGLAGSIKIDDWIFDHTGHYLHLKDGNLNAFLSSIVELITVARNAAIAFRDRFVPYPFQQNLWALRPEDAIDMLMGVIRAYSHQKAVCTFEDWIVASVGHEMADAFMIPYNRKLYGVDLKYLEPKQGGRYIPKPNLREIVQGALIPPKDNVGYNATFLYPKFGGMQTVVDALAYPIRNRILLDHEVVSINVTRHEVCCQSGDRFNYDPPLISTIPLPILVSLIETENKSYKIQLDMIKKLVCSLKATRILNINIGIKGEVTVPYHWIYVPDECYPFYRIGINSNVNPKCCPDGYSNICAEINIRTKSQTYTGLINDTLKGIKLMRIIPSEALIEKIYVDEIWPGYVLFQKDDDKRIAKAHDFLRKVGIMSVGRYGKWDYMSMEESFKDGLKAVGCLASDIFEIFENSQRR